MAELLNKLYETFASFPELFFFLAPLIGGEIGVLFMAFTASAFTFSIQSVWLWAVLAMAITDVFWFLVPRWQKLQYVIRKPIQPSRLTRLKERVDHIAEGRSYVMLAVAKLLVGVRIPFIVYLGTTSVSTKRFIGAALVVNSLWAAILVVIGILARNSFTYTLHTLQNVQLTIFVSLLFGFICYGGYRYLKRKIDMYE